MDKELIRFEFTIDQIFQIIERMTRCKCITDGYLKKTYDFKKDLLFQYGLAHIDACEYEYKIHPFKQKDIWNVWGDFEKAIPPRNVPLLIYTIDAYGNGKPNIAYVGNNGEWYGCYNKDNIDFVNYWAHIPLSDEMLNQEYKIKLNHKDYMNIKK